VIAAFYLFVFWLQSSDGKTYIYRDKGFLILKAGEKNHPSGKRVQKVYIKNKCLRFRRK
jgi:hypothetical protein